MPLDFNHGSGALIGGKPTTAATTDAINALIDQALERRRAEQPERDYIGASELGDPCLRKLYYSAAKAEKEPFSGQKLRIFEAGHVYETLVADWLQAAGFQLVTHNHDGGQFEFVTGNGRIKGHIDGVIVSGPQIPSLSYPALWENKALKNKFWNQIVKNGVRKAEPKYFAQVQLYEGYFDLAACLFTTINKDTAEIWHEVVPYEVAEAQRYSDRGVELIRFIDTQITPERIASRPDFYLCKWCQFSRICWEGAT